MVGDSVGGDRDWSLWPWVPSVLMLAEPGNVCLLSCLSTGRKGRCVELEVLWHCSLSSLTAEQKRPQVLSLLRRPGSPLPPSEAFVSHGHTASLKSIRSWFQCELCPLIAPTAFAMLTPESSCSLYKMRKISSWRRRLCMETKEAKCEKQLKYSLRNN